MTRMKIKTGTRFGIRIRIEIRRFRSVGMMSTIWIRTRTRGLSG